MKKSIQADKRIRDLRGTAKLQAETLAKACCHGLAWTNVDVSVLVNGIQKDETTYDMAIRLGRSYYSVQGARAHIRFAMDHIDVIKPRQKRK